MVELINFLNNQSIFLLFIFFLGILFIITALLMILTESAVHSILYLMILFLYLTELTILLKMEFLALIFIIVYIGAVCVLMLFHIKLIKLFVHRYDNINDKELFLPFILISIILPLMQVLTLLNSNRVDSVSLRLLGQCKVVFSDPTYHGVFITRSINSNYTSWIDLLDSFKNTEMLGIYIYNIYFLYLIIGSFILLIAMIGSIFLTIGERKNKKFQKIHEQILMDISKFYNNINK